MATGDALKTGRHNNDRIVNLPAEAPDEVASVIAVRLDGKPSVSPYAERRDENGVIRLGVKSSEIEARFEQRAKENFLGHVFVTRWTRPDDILTWKIAVPKAGRYQIDMSYVAAKGPEGGGFMVAVGAASISGTVRDTGGDIVFKPHSIGQLALPPGEHTLQVKSEAKAGTVLMHL